VIPFSNFLLKTVRTVEANFLSKTITTRHVLKRIIQPFLDHVIAKNWAIIYSDRYTFLAAPVSTGSEMDSQGVFKTIPDSGWGTVE
jgi:hypothetical protein